MAGAICFAEVIAMGEWMDISIKRQAELTALASRLASSWPRPDRPVQLGAADRLSGRAEAYFVQDEMARLLAEKGEEIAGWKVGATSARMRELDGHEDIIPGRIFRSRIWLGNQLQLPAGPFSQVRIETEFAFELIRDLPDPASLADGIYRPEMLVSSLALRPAFEIIGIRYQADGLSQQENSLLAIGDNGGGVAFVFGDRVDGWQSWDFQNLEISLSVDGVPPAENFLGEMRCVPIEAVADLANHLLGRGYRLKAGDFVSTGAATVPQPLARGSGVQADFGRLGQMQISISQD